MTYCYAIRHKLTGLWWADVVWTDKLYPDEKLDEYIMNDCEWQALTWDEYCHEMRVT